MTSAEIDRLTLADVRRILLRLHQILTVRPRPVRPAPTFVFEDPEMRGIPTLGWLLEHRL